MDEVLDKEGVGIRDKLKVKVGNGSKTRFWHDVWVDQSPLKDRFPAIFALAKNKSGWVADYIVDRESRIQWAWDWLRAPMSTSEWAQVGSLMALLHQTPITEAMDQWIFENDSGDPFSVKELRNQLLRYCRSTFSME
ncbi:hypothetical protein HanIR_Chr15g0753911 [Helianthus annuus]|nr:hypothetical protein HanIR_Chr15g0753911 [Helianthus annuus]